MPYTSLPRFRRPVLKLAAAMAGLAGLSSCAAPVIGGLTAAEVFSLAGLSATIMTGRDLTEHAVSAITGKDCRFLETLLRDGRSFCETPDTVATRGDFQGVFALLGDGETVKTASSLDPDLLGFAPVDRRGAEDFSLEVARKKADSETHPLSFGMLSAAFGQSWTYDVHIRGSDAGGQTAESAPAHAARSLGLRPSRGDYFGL
ncbi:MAG: hypothetical protein WBG82_01855 [Parvibaculum sp.]|uniref:hypothetical protein n=1 Tax=Parvibaculum sp. TaxID=2024848 RepID=UPI003C76F226